MNNINPYIIEQLGLSDEQFAALEEKFAVIEPIVSEYTTPKEKQELRVCAQVQLGICERTLRKYIRDYKINGISGLIRTRRNDYGTHKVFDPLILTRALELLKENPYRSVRMLLKLMREDPKYATQAKIIKRGTLYHYLRKSGYSFKNGRGGGSQKVYHKFEADYANQLWQGDARHGFEVEHPDRPGKSKMVYCFAWADDYSRKILYAKYYFDEKLISLEDSFRQAVLRWAIPEKIYVDNGSAYISKQFTLATDTIGTRKIHHPPYQAYCKGKIESIMKRLKEFQREAKCAGVKTIDELNSALWSWIEIEYNQKTHSSTGETPNERYAKSINKHIPKRVKNLELFNSCFLWREKRTISKYGTISLNKNSYRIKDIGIGERVKVFFDPQDMKTVYIYYKEKHHSTVSAYKLSRDQYFAVPEEKNKSNQEISQASKQYLENIRKKHQEQKSKESDFGFSNLINEEDEHDK